MSGAKNDQGLALLELLVAITIFTAILGLCLHTAVTGFRMFGQTNVRQRLQRDTGAVFSWVRRDVEATNLLLSEVVPRSAGLEPRDSVAFVGLTSWEAPLPLTSLGEPQWNQVVAYTATREEPYGQLLRQSLNPAPAHVPLSQPGVSGFQADLLNGTADLKDQRRLAGGIKAFSVARNLTDESFQFTLKVAAETVEAGGGRGREEVLEVQTAIHPRNTSPKV